MAIADEANMRESVWRRAWNDSCGAIQTVWFWGLQVIGDAMAAVGTAVIAQQSSNVTATEAALYGLLGAASGGVSLTAIVGTVNLALAPLRQRHEARRRVGQLEDVLANRNTGVEVICSYPVLHKETGVAPLGQHILVPGLSIVNHMDRTLDCELELTVELMADGGLSLLPMESSEIVNAKMSLPGTLRGNKQYREPIRIDKESRDIGFAAFRADEVHEPTEVDAEWSMIERMTLEVWDAVNHVQMAEHEIWPAMWPEILNQDVQVDIGGRAVIPTPTQQSKSDAEERSPQAAAVVTD